MNIKINIEQRRSNVYNIILILFLLPFFKPDIIVVSYPKVNLLIFIWQALNCIVLSCIYVKKNKISKFFLLTILYYFMLLISTFINKGNINKWLVDFILNISIIMIVELNLKNNKINLLKYLTIIFYVLTLANTASFIIFKQGLAQTEFFKTPIYLIGIDNRFSFTYIPGLCVIAIYDLLKNNRYTKLTYGYFMITFITLVYFWSAGALFAEALFFVYYIFIYKMKISYLSKYYFGTILISFYALVIIRIQNIFSFLIVKVLHKDLTFSFRTIIWDKALKYINSNKILGIGIQNNANMVGKISAYHSHSNFLNILLQGGYGSLIAYIFIIFSAFFKLNKFRNNKIAQLISFTIFDIFIMLIFDTFDITANLFLIMCLGYNVYYLTEEDNKNE